MSCVPGNVKNAVEYLFNTKNKDAGVVMHFNKGRVKSTVVGDERIVTNVDELETVLNTVRHGMYGSVSLTPTGTGNVRVKIERNIINTDER